MRLSTDEWQARLGVGHIDTDFHGKLQDALYRHGLALLRQGIAVILEDGLWTTHERTAKFSDARACSALIELHVFDVGYDTLWDRLQRRNEQAKSADYPITEAELRWAWDIFEPLSPTELIEVDSYTRHTGGQG